MQYRYLRFPFGKEKAVTLSYDDGPKYDIRLAEIMNKNGIKGAFNINSAFISNSGDSWYMSADEIRKNILDAGHEIAVHGKEHRAPGRISSTALINDVFECRKTLENEFGIIVRGMAYPDSGIRAMRDGNSYEDIRKIASDIGIVYSRTLGGDNTGFDIPNDFLAWMPTAYHINPDLFNMIDMFLEPIEKRTGVNSNWREPKLFYLWGHSYEFNRDNNWDRIESACEKLGGHDDVWYATNIEIYDYVMGYRNLRFNVDETIVYNPNTFDVWFEADKNLFCVKSGETLNIQIEKK